MAEECKEEEQMPHQDQQSTKAFYFTYPKRKALIKLDPTSMSTEIVRNERYE